MIEGGRVFAVDTVISWESTMSTSPTALRSLTTLPSAGARVSCTASVFATTSVPWSTRTPRTTSCTCAWLSARSIMMMRLYALTLLLVHSAQLKFNPEVSSWFGFSKKKLLSDYLLGGIYEGDCVDEKKKICHIDGTWLGSIEFDGLPYWKFDESPAKFMPIAVDSPLPSDCRYREDIIYLKAQDIPAAGEYVQPSHYLLLPLNSLTHSLTCSVRQCRWKHTLEERQRRDARLRKDWEKQNKKGAKKDKKSDKKSKKDSSQ